MRMNSLHQQLRNYSVGELAQRFLPEISRSELEEEASDYILSADESSDYILSPDEALDYILSPDEASDYILSPFEASDYILSPDEASDSAYF
ncbi:hypothetical protein KP79_PYT25071 [Mizuhopecten yessoensis]|uniref:Uncharacterized protein n=1 Tax=Mizuhopecten yessoensis TaxID=6573 RepID=A0A210PWY6_MIZYE|nr:hypothetical protein KP79_PYT25071 [Mizuhopecten yessoensis]